MDIRVDDDELAGFNEHARTELQKATAEFIDELVREANRIEATRNPSPGIPQVTSGMVTDAAVLVRRGLTKPKKSLGAKVARIAAAVLSLLVGLAYNAEALQHQGYMLFFILMVTVTILAVTIAVIME